MVTVCAAAAVASAELRYDAGRCSTVQSCRLTMPTTPTLMLSILVRIRNICMHDRAGVAGTVRDGRTNGRRELSCSLWQHSTAIRCR